MAGEQELPIKIRYFGLDADAGRVSLGQLGESLQGAAKLLGVAGHYSITRQVVKKSTAITAVRVLVEPPKSGSVDIIGFVVGMIAAELPLFQKFGLQLVGHVVTYVLAKLGGADSEAQMAMRVAETALTQMGETSRSAIEGMREAMNLVAQSQRVAAKSFVAPIGETCSGIQVIEGDAERITVTPAMKDNITAGLEPIIEDEKSYRVLISEMDLRSRRCKVSIEGDEEAEKRYVGEITDPVLAVPNNPYVEAMAAQKWITVTAKASIEDGEIGKLFISNAPAG